MRCSLVIAIAALTASAASALALLACSPPGANQPTGPMRVLERDRAEGARARCLVALLPGIGDSPESYLEHGFVERLRAARVDADLRLVNAHFGYYREESLVPRLLEDVVEPAEAAGYEQLWLVGISLGGLGSLALTTADPSRIDGLILIAPYLGDEAQIDAVQRAGWPAAPDAPLEEPFDRIWRWLATREAGDPSLLVAYGSADRYGAGHRLATGALPERDVLVGAGGHTWPVWEQLWRAVIESGRLQRACGVPRSAE